MAKWSDVALVGSIIVLGYAAYSVIKGFKFPDLFGGIGDVFGGITKPFTEPMTYPGDVKAPSLVTQWEMGVGKRGYLYEEGRIAGLPTPEEAAFKGVGIQSELQKESIQQEAMTKTIAIGTARAIQRKVHKGILPTRLETEQLKAVPHVAKEVKGIIQKPSVPKDVRIQLGKQVVAQEIPQPLKKFVGGFV